MGELVAAILAVSVSVVTAIGSLIVSKINRKKLQSDLDGLREAINGADGDYFVMCPFCGKRIRLRDVQVYVEEEAHNGGTD